MSTTADVTPRARWMIAAVACACVAAPFFVVAHVPSTDMPQHVAQIRLLFDALADPAGPYRVNWLTPYATGYAMIALLFRFLSPPAAARMALGIVAVVWVATTHLLAAKRGRSPAAAMLVSVCAFNLSLYYGFYSFLCGWPFFAMWMLLLAPGAPASSTRDRAVLAVKALALLTLLFFTHALWYVAAVLWTGVSLATDRSRWRDVPILLASGVVSAILPIVWYIDFATTKYAAAATSWLLLDRYAAPEFWRAALGGVRGPLDVAVFATIVAWLLVSLWQHRFELRARVDPYLAVGAATFALAAAVLPVRYQSTILFGPRWLSIALVLVVLALPPPKLSDAMRLTIAVATLAVYCAITALFWRSFDTQELSGLDAAIAAVPANPRIMQMSFVDESEFLIVEPVDHIVAYAQAEKGGILNFSFASFPHSLVVFKSDADAYPPWSEMKPSDVKYFDFALVNATEPGHERVLHSGFVPVTTTGRWRLYRIPGSSSGIRWGETMPASRAPAR